MHGANRLGANSLLDLVVFGRQAADTTAELVKPNSRWAGLGMGGGEGPGGFVLRFFEGGLRAQVGKFRVEGSRGGGGGFSPRLFFFLGGGEGLRLRFAFVCCYFEG